MPESVDLEKKRIFLVVSSDENRRQIYSNWIQTHISGATVFTAHDGVDALFKFENVPPQVLITEMNLPKMTGLELVERVLNHKHGDVLSVVVLSDLPDQEHFIDDVVRGKVQFLTETANETKFNQCLTKALNRLASFKDNEYSLHFLSPDQILFNEGDTAKSVYIVKRGRLTAFKGSENEPVSLGEIQVGEFVGEMAHINKESRSASVKALEDCELIEIPEGSLDLVLFSKPAWSHALMKTLSKRLKLTNDTIVKITK